VSEQTRSDGTPPRWTAERLILAGGGMFVLGLIALAAAMLISVKRGGAPVALALLTLLIPIGLAICFSGLLVQFRERRRP
jgi:hypothetical protein